MKLIIFDYDGVLMDTFESTVKIYQDIAYEFKLNLPEDHEFYKDFFELDWRETMRKLKITSKDDLEKQEMIFRKGLKKYDNLIKPYEGIPELLDNLSKKYTLAIVTNNLKDELDFRLNKFDMAKYFKKILTCEDGKMKPDPDLLIKCMKHFNASPQDTVFIGDMDGDIISGKTAKIGKIIAVAYGYHTKHKLKSADFIVNSPEEIGSVL